MPQCRGDASWYERTLGFKLETYSSPAAPRQRLALKFGQHKVNLRRTGDASWWTCKVDAPGSLDLCFVTEGSLKPVIARLEAAGISIVAAALMIGFGDGDWRGPAPRSGAFGPMTSIYCEDPDGNLVEVSTYARDPVA